MTNGATATQPARYTVTTGQDSTRAGFVVHDLATGEDVTGVFGEKAAAEAAADIFNAR